VLIGASWQVAGRGATLPSEAVKNATRLFT
jgi:hypothetical protein